MKKFLIYLVASLVIIAISAMVGLRNPSVQDKVMISVLEGLIPSSNLPEEDSLSAVICGSRSPIPSPGRAQTCVMVRAGENIYIVDIGDGSASNLRNWGIPFNKIKSVLLTHLHSDHISDLADLHQASWLMQRRKAKLDVYGPQGVGLVTKGFETAYEPDYFFRNTHHGDQIAPLDVAGLNPLTVDLNQPKIINEDGLIVTAFEVVHDPVKPALGYRFDYKGRSLVISGDTSYSENLIENSRDVDVLIHEAQANHMINLLRDFNLQMGANLNAKLMEDITTYHTTPVEAAEIANLANVKHLIFYHLTPAPRNLITEIIFLRGVDEVREEWTLSRDGTMVVLPVESDEVIFSRT
jgi:ribonuclease Z|tara:strand:+ start:2144 stop:3202 length:1059 start_codon:yes stop_codon:yes gene_type:complete